MITITINRSTCHIEAPDDVIKKLGAVLSYTEKNAYWSEAVRVGRWDGVYRLMTQKTHNFKLGLLYRTLFFLENEGLEFELIDNRKFTPNFQMQYLDPNRVLFIDDKGKDVKLRDVQIEAIESYCKLRYAIHLGRGIFDMKPRSGKTIVAGVLGQVLNEYPIIFIVHRIDIALQAKTVFEKIFKEKIGLIGDGIFDVDSCNVVVATVQSIDSAFEIKEDFEEKEHDTGHYDEIRDFINSVKVVFIDECHCSGASTFQQLPKFMKDTIYIAGFSGTPSRDQGDDLLIEQLCGAITYVLPAMDSIDKKYTLPCVVYAVTLPEIEVKSPTYTSQEKWGINNNEYILQAIEKIVQRMEAKNLSCVINVRKVEHGEMIQKRLGCEFLWGGIPSEKRKKIYDKLQKKEILTIVSTVTDIGIDIPSLNAVILARVTLSKVSAFQWIRCNTPFENKKFGYVFLLCPRVKNVSKDYLKRHGNYMKRLYKADPTFKVIEKKFEEL